MKQFLLVVLLGLILPTRSVSMKKPEPGVIKDVAKLSGLVLRCVFAAKKELEQKKIPLEKYDISILENQNSVMIVLKTPGQAVTVRGDMGKFPGYEVEVRKIDLHIARSNYIR